MRARPIATVEKNESPLESVRTGFNFIRNNAAILGLMSYEHLTCQELINRLSFDHAWPLRGIIFGTGPAGLGALLGVPALGALVGSGIVMAVGNPRRKGKLIIWVTLLYTAGLICFALSRSFAMALAVVSFLGLVDAIGETLRDTLIQVMTPDRIPRPGKKLRPGFYVTRRVYMGHAQLGTAASLMGVPGALVLGGCLGSVAVLLVAKFAHTLRSIDT